MILSQMHNINSKRKGNDLARNRHNITFPYKGHTIERLAIYNSWNIGPIIKVWPYVNNRPFRYNAGREGTLRCLLH